MSRNAESRFSHLPSVDIQRSKFKRPFKHLTTFNAGQLVPFFVDQVLPGDTFSIDTAALIRMTTPIFPTMDNAYLDMYYFFVPSRLVWEHWKEFNGENSTGYWTQPIEYQIPQLHINQDADNIGEFDAGFLKGDLADYMGIPTKVNGLSVDALPFRAYVLIWNEWFRDQNTMQPAYFTKGDAVTPGYSWSQVLDENPDVNELDLRLLHAINGSCTLPVSKFHDYFTSCLPQPQKGPAVDLPLYQNNIPVGAFDEQHDYGGANIYFKHYGENLYEGPVQLGLNGIEMTYDPSSSFTPAGNDIITPTNLYADVSNVAVATISQLRQAFQLQRLYEKDARGGTRYREILLSHFGVVSPDARQQVPEYLGGKRIPINIDQVLQTSSTDNISPQGNTAAYSMTVDKDSSFTKSFTEHGYILGVCCVRTDHTYQQGLERFWSRKNRFDFYWPALAHISEQAVLVKEIYANGTEQDDDAFGYQEAWADYRYKPNRVSGAMRSNYDLSLDSWHYADFYTGGNTNFVLNADWLVETKNNIDRTLAVPSNLEDQFICDFYLDMECVRPMPLYSVPGLIDHY